MYQDLPAGNFSFSLKKSVGLAALLGIVPLIGQHYLFSKLFLQTLAPARQAGGWPKEATKHRTAVRCGSVQLKSEVKENQFKEIAVFA